MKLISFPSKYHLMSSGFGTERASQSIDTVSPSDPTWVLFDNIFGGPKRTIRNTYLKWNNILKISVYINIIIKIKFKYVILEIKLLSLVNWMHVIILVIRIL